VTTQPLSLLPHPASPLWHGVSVQVQAERTDAGLRLSYSVRAPARHLRLPDAAPPGFADHLWQHTCLEAFVARPGETHYREFNFSPSGQYAEYHFSEERVGVDPTPKPLAPALHWTFTEEQVDLVAQVTLSGLAVGHQDLLIGLSAVLEGANGQLTYWALGHPKNRPDFHDRKGWSLRLPHLTTSSC